MIDLSSTKGSSTAKEHINSQRTAQVPYSGHSYTNRHRWKSSACFRDKQIMSTNTLVIKKLDVIADLIETKKSWCDTGNITWNIKEAGDKCQGLFDFSLNNSMDDQIWSWRSSAIMAMQILAHGWTAGELWTLAAMLAFHYIPSSHFCFYPSQVFLMQIPTFSDEISALSQELTELLWSMPGNLGCKHHKLA